MFFKRYVLGNIKGILLLVSLATMSTLLGIVPPALVQWYMDSVLGGTNTDLVFKAFIAILLAMVAGEICKVLFMYFYSEISFNLVMKIKNSIFYNLIHLPYELFRKQYNRSMNLFVNDIKSLQSTGIETVPEIIISIFIAIGSAIYLSFINPLFLIGTIIVSLISLLPLYYINKRQGKLVEEAHKYEQDMTEYIKNFIDKPIFTKIINKNILISNGFKKIARLNMLFSLKRELNFRAYLVIRVFFDSLVPAFIFGYGGYLYIIGQLSIGEVVASLLLVPSITKPINNITGYYLILKDLVPRIKRIITFSKIAPKAKEHPLVSIPKVEINELEFVGITYEVNGLKILNNASFKITEGQNTVITGESGAGKSTIFNLLLGLYNPQIGEIRINDVSYENVDFNQLRNFFAISAQDVLFLNDSIKNNLKAFNQMATDEEIKRALYLSCCDEFIDQLPEGINTNIGENGNKLSGGQRQRLSIARALITNRKFLLLDEATSALNTELEKELFNRLYQQNDITIIQIAHRPSCEEYSLQKIHIENKKLTTYQIA